MPKLDCWRIFSPFSISVNSGDLPQMGPKYHLSTDERKMRTPMGDCLEQKIGIDPGHDIIENDRQSSLAFGARSDPAGGGFIISKIRKKRNPPITVVSVRGKRAMATK